MSRKKRTDYTEAEWQALIDQNKDLPHRYFEPEFLRAMNENVAPIMDEVYFRSEFVGFDDFPERNDPNRPLIFVSNHSGMAFPWDAIIFVSKIFRMQKYGPNAIRTLTAPMLSQSVLMNPFLLPNLWRRAGAIDATALNFETMMQTNDYNLLIYPEGVPGIGKGFNRRYQLQRFSTSYLIMALKYKTDIIPFYTINGEFINPYSYNIHWVNRLANKIGIPFIPMCPVTPLIPLQPWLFYFAFPAKLTYVIGKRIKPYELITKPFDEITKEELHDLNDQIHRQMQEEMYTAVGHYGVRPYKLDEMLRKVWHYRGKFPFTFPFAWPVIFTEFYRIYDKFGKDTRVQIKPDFWNFFRLIWKNPLSLAFYLPLLGWIPIIIKGFNKKAVEKTANR